MGRGLGQNIEPHLHFQKQQPNEQEAAELLRRCFQRCRRETRRPWEVALKQETGWFQKEEIFHDVKGNREVWGVRLEKPTLDFSTGRFHLAENVPTALLPQAGQLSIT